MQSQSDKEVQGYAERDNLFLLKQMWPYIKPYRKHLLIVFLSLPFVSFFNAVQPFLFKQAIDLFTTKQYLVEDLWHHPLFFPGILAISAIIATALQIIQNLTVQTIGQRFVASIRDKLFRHLQSLSIDFFEKTQTGKLLTRLTSDLEALSETLSSGLVGASNDLFNIIGMMIFMLILNWKLSLAEFALIPVILILLQVFQQMYRKASNAARIYLSELNSLFQESLWGVLVIKLFSSAESLNKRFQKINLSYKKSNDRYITIDASFSSLIELVGIIGILLLLIVALGLQESITAGELVAFVGYSQLLFYPIQSLSEKFGIFQSSFIAMEKVVSILEVQPSNSIHTNDVISKDKYWPIQSFSVKNISFSYAPDSPLVLRDISFDLKKGDSLGIIGRTGAGKSTLIKLLTHFYRPTKGEILINNQYNLSFINPQELRKHILLIPQRSFLFSGSIRDNLLLDKQMPDILLEDICEDTGLLSIIKQLPQGLDSELREGGVDLSGGQRQLIALTRSIVQDPDILILDEATADLDPYAESLITKTTKKILNSGKTVIFIAHRMNLVTECNKILVLRQGAIIENGTHKELMEQEQSHYSHLYNLSALV